MGRIRESLSDTRWHKAWRMFIDFFDMPRLIHFLIEIIAIGALSTHSYHARRTTHDTRKTHTLRPHTLMMGTGADRIVYFSMLPTGVLNDQPAVVYILLGEVPIYLFFSIYTALVSFWYLPSVCVVSCRVVRCVCGVCGAYPTCTRVSCAVVQGGTGALPAGAEAEPAEHREADQDGVPRGQHLHVLPPRRPHHRLLHPRALRALQHGTLGPLCCRVVSRAWVGIRVCVIEGCTGCTSSPRWSSLR